MADADRLGGEELGQVEGEAHGQRDAAPSQAVLCLPDGCGEHSRTGGQQEQTRSEQDDAGSKTYRVRDRQEARGATVVRLSADGCESPKVSTP